jgi:hypothetical protein
MNVRAFGDTVSIRRATRVAIETETSSAQRQLLPELPLARKPAHCAAVCASLSAHGEQQLRR